MSELRYFYTIHSTSLISCFARKMSEIDLCCQHFRYFLRLMPFHCVVSLVLMFHERDFFGNLFDEHGSYAWIIVQTTSSSAGFIEGPVPTENNELKIR